MNLVLIIFAAICFLGAALNQSWLGLNLIGAGLFLWLLSGAVGAGGSWPWQRSQ